MLLSSIRVFTVYIICYIYMYKPNSLCLTTIMVFAKMYMYIKDKHVRPYMSLIHHAISQSQFKFIYRYVVFYGIVLGTVKYTKAPYPTPPTHSKDPLFAITTYHPACTIFQDTLQENWHLLGAPSTQQLYSTPVTFGKRKSQKPS